MKKTILFFYFLVSMVLNGTSQKYNVPIDSMGNVVYQEIVNCNITKSKLYTNAQDWTAKTFGDYKKVIQFEDDENGKLILKGNCNVKHFVEVNILGMLFSNREKIRFTLTIECRENKYRYTIDNILVILEIGDEKFNNSILSRINDIKLSRNNIESLSEKLVSIKNKDVTSYKRKQLKEHQNNISQLEKRIKSRISSIDLDTKFIESELEAVNSLISSIKNAMSKNDNF